MAIVLALLIGTWLATVMISSQAYAVGETPQQSDVYQRPGATDTLAKTAPQRQTTFQRRVPTYS
ncbi:hypothetical protein [Leptothoe kymatousa]|uniref:Uncharacterized protein n=1 Tax=Leptothoe kymatousa TAU-MAC 1615 TaxID=2364775 RepID=A0ABS5Y667_9CYAN|nr:hypothetical protein [Leptothoe kymatousa]MBT9313332.1 hypothetical protein [Leptothoe kymatousa TAU-MAC 1615]